MKTFSLSFRLYLTVTLVAFFTLPFFFKLLLWSGVSTTSSFYRLDELVGGEGQSGDGDAFFMFCILLVALDFALLFFASWKSFKTYRKQGKTLI